MGKPTTLTCSKSPHALLCFIQCGVSPVKSNPFSFEMRAGTHREVRSSFGLHHQLPPWLHLPPRQRGLDLLCSLVPHTHTLPPWQPPGSQSPIHHYFSSQDPLSRPFTQCQVSPLLSSVTITFFLFTTLSTKRIQDSQAPLKIHSGPTLKKGKKTSNLRKETH